MSTKTVTVATPQAGDVLWDTSEKVFDDIRAHEGQKATVFIHSVPFEGSVSLVNLMTSTRLQRKGFKLTIVLYGPAVLLAAAGRGYPAVGTEGFPGNLSVNKQLKVLLDEGATIYACRFAMGALYGMREDDLIPGVKAFNPLDVLDSALTAWREGHFQLNTWTM
ncbi:MSMEG_0572 family nitrogen starvation response protein [Streptosporangium sp. NBC_01755]|uniref:MSMEG_0572/Sll0783 family nitrogen starvation response protein n=1 Tax=unclassified Streptosporangium TaxID=2632669 RepID=UPI002DDB33B9|nr:MULTISPECIES: MSMEG_0572/Sll0783 family nitrogen starvation response protein [unclassified Streptosporangium]WSA26455.1 MSMEG_0572 family nitrogen starvation response protein [Streptosporangium sp. NBC_01810]WSD02115.1 MSMEG_0572 family nitrogen starvation response protein [Streptosporangium sp. NBC_01755]